MAKAIGGLCLSVGERVFRVRVKRHKNTASKLSIKLKKGCTAGFLEKNPL
jgi:hypothetical protein